MGHVLPVVAIQSVAGKKLDTTETQKLVTAFRHYLIARQLNDDAHDWSEDLRRGHMTPVVAMILNELKVRPGKHELNSLLGKSRKQFWNITLPKVCKLIRHHTQLSRQALEDSNMLKQENVLASMLDGIESSVSDTLTQQAQAKDFLKHYRTSAKKRTEA
jgi:hypothetical protein